MAKLIKQPLPIFIKSLDLRDIKPRERHGGHLWCDKQVLRMFKLLFERKDYKNLRNIYLTLCQIDSDFCEAREEFLAGNEISKNRELHSLIKTCTSYAGMDRKTVIKYMQILRELTLIKYGRRQDEGGRISGSYLILFEYIPFLDYYKNLLGMKSDEQIQFEKDIRNDHSPKKPTKVKRDHIKNASRSIKNESKDSKSFSKEKDRPNELGRTKNILSLKIKKRKKKTNNNGLLYNSLAKPIGRADLSKWLTKHNINKYDDREKAIHEFQNEMFVKNISPATTQIKEVLDYWNKTATEMRNNGYKLPVHQIKDTKNIYMCQLIITGILHTSGLTVEDLKKSIDNYSWILENSPWYNKIYPFPKFFSNKKLFDDCITNNVEDNSRYVNSKRKISSGGLLEGVIRLHKKTHGWEPSDDDVRMYKHWIKEGDIKSEKDFVGYVS